MPAKKVNSPARLGFYSTFEEQLSHTHPLYIPANQVQWQIFEDAFAKYYSDRRPPCQTNPFDGIAVDA